MANKPFYIGGKKIDGRGRTLIELPLPPLYTHTPLTIPVHVIRGTHDGPRLFVCAALHGDELNGTEIIRRLLNRAVLKRLRGTLIALPMVNVYGMIQHSRYLPDRRDLNRSFPGSKKGSLASRLANLFMEEVVDNCTHGIDLHTGALNRCNLPHIRADLTHPETAQLARNFGVPVVLDATLRDGSLREAASERGIPMLLYEAGEALRFDEVSIRAGVQGIVRVMRTLDMLPASKRRRTREQEPFVANSSTWIRAPASGLFRKISLLGSRIKKGEIMGFIDDPFGSREIEVIAGTGGVVIGCTEIPLLHEGEALFHIARFKDSDEVAEQVESFQTALAPNDQPLHAEDEEPPIG